MVKIAPSILSADFANLEQEIVKAEAAGADWIHMDVMDGHFVPNLTMGPAIVAAVRKVTKLPLDVHLMVSNPQDFIQPFAEAGADILTVHVETAPHLHRLVQQIRDLHIRAGVALNPSTSLSALEEILGELDLVLVMSVNPGFGGQKFISSAVPKIARLHSMIAAQQASADIEVDGGINAQTAKQVRAAGAGILVAGSAVYGAPDAAQAIRDIRGE